jgi:hypothetical protein
MDRVAIVAWCWFIAWVTAGYAVGSLAFNTPWTGALVGFIAALLSTFAWPWAMPERINRWMDDPVAWAD